MAIQPGTYELGPQDGKLLVRTGKGGAASKAGHNLLIEVERWGATAQFAEGLYRDAADSYRRLVALVGEQSAEADDLLGYADALRLSGRADDARAIYQRLSASTSEDVAATARGRLAELAQTQTAQLARLLVPQHARCVLIRGGHRRCRHAGGGTPGVASVFR